ncbi:hypothetical protein MICAK_1280006 [Microcystis aeruginosa PCC 9701]|uniref:Uncharacterized protein n=2 Tax=Microcystis TaxID=1125 RepID=I4IL76_MICAE|nr:hypothetical protein MICAK_1280006 [Microcystis aeruginosa PCC 9701]
MTLAIIISLLTEIFQYQDQITITGNRVVV